MVLIKEPRPPNMVQVAPSKRTLTDQSHRAVQSERVRVRAQLSVRDLNNC